MSRNDARVSYKIKELPAGLNLSKQTQDRLLFLAMVEELTPDTQERILDLIDEWEVRYRAWYNMEPYEALDRATDFVEDNILFFFMDEAA